jgi:hypothetical protein
MNYHKQAATEDVPEGNIAERSYNKLKGKYEELDPNIKSLLGTGLGGAALGGGLGYLLTGDRSGETESARRKRVIANALLGAGLGGIAGAGIPAGLSSIEQASQKSDGDKIEDALLEYAPPAAAGAGGSVLAGLGLGKFLNRDSVKANQQKAINSLNNRASATAGRSVTPFNEVGEAMDVDSKNVRQALRGNQVDVLSSLKKLGIGTNRLLNAGSDFGILGKKLTDLTGNSTDFEKAYRKMQRRKSILGKLGKASILGAGGLAGLGAYKSIIG